MGAECSGRRWFQVGIFGKKGKEGAGGDICFMYALRRCVCIHELHQELTTASPLPSANTLSGNSANLGTTDQPYEPFIRAPESLRRSRHRSGCHRRYK